MPTPTKDTDYWGEDPLYTLEHWKYEVANNYTRRGYWEWVAACADESEPPKPNETKR